jgi:hypothetical protein
MTPEPLALIRTVGASRYVKAPFGTKLVCEITSKDIASYQPAGERVQSCPVGLALEGASKPEIQAGMHQNVHQVQSMLKSTAAN